MARVTASVAGWHFWMCAARLPLFLYVRVWHPEGQRKVVSKEEGEAEDGEGQGVQASSSV